MWWKTECVFVYYETIKLEVNKRLTYECRCDERLKPKPERSTHLCYSGDRNTYSRSWILYYETRKWSPSLSHTRWIYQILLNTSMSMVSQRRPRSYVSTRISKIRLMNEGMSLVLIDKARAKKKRPIHYVVVYYKSRNRELKIRLMNESRCDERLKSRVQDDICLTYTGLHDKTN